jgi:hypothetical protein
MDRNTYLLHQVHPAKLATDIGADVVVSTWLMWHRQPRTALLLAHTAAALASATVTHWDLSPLQTTRRGRYVLIHMPPSAQAMCYPGQVVAWYAAYHRAGQHRAGARPHRSRLVTRTASTDRNHPQTSDLVNSQAAAFVGCVGGGPMSCWTN